MTMFWAGILVTSWLGLVLLTAELIHAWFPNAKEWSRKVVHIGAGQVILIAYALGVPTSWGIVAAAIAGVVTLLSYRIAIFPSISGVGRQSWGTFFYAVSIGTLMALFWNTLPELAVLGILVMAWGDGLAALVGINWGRHPLPRTSKSWEGTLTMFCVSTVVAALSLTPIAALELLWIAPLVGLGATLLELIAWRGVDNLTVPIGSALLAYGLLNLS
ncbi:MULTISPECIES: SEC59/DGK1/VTE5 family protein [unclassified Thermosynechococcus]|uniref:diacylglycerol/polyprenol kinase family protein n=1 Tax=unclassified Thermosynechococcus TaxID=2622553 RepID=UPI0028772D7F|nr:MULTISPECIES: SEC59/DGK1/VTE5 family protein [unclassified Thermosynechococcus]WNC52004.1 SEC59/DGK1/VTE5 family protein [Thermosynechococcus sp. TG215]WNC57087.1 SEC59/DGK1/VTE5 family protein [Thermosynechococcus sp. TG218]